MNIVGIRQKCEEIVAHELGAEFRALPHQFDIDANDSRSLEAGYSVLWGDAAESPEHIDQAINVVQGIEVQITRRVFVRTDDSKAVAALDEVYGAIGRIIDRFVMDRMDSAGTVQEVRFGSMSKPAPIGNGRDIYGISLLFRVRYLN